MAATTILEHEQGFAHPKYACTVGYTNKNNNYSSHLHGLLVRARGIIVK